MKAEIIAIGTEILLGEIIDTNSAYIAQRLPELGIDLFYKSVVGDNIGRIVETFDRAWNRSDIIFCTGGLGPTDTAASLRAIEIEADLLLKATKVDGIYDADPMLNPSAKRYDRLTYDQVLDQRLNVMDQTSVVLCRDHHLPLRVFNLNDPGALVRAATGGDVGTLVTN